jgi:hypothetical protein
MCLFRVCDGKPFPTEAVNNSETKIAFNKKVINSGQEGKRAILSH